MGTTSRGLRYPEPTDRVADGAVAMTNLANDVTAQLNILHLPGAQVLGMARNNTDVTSTSTSYTTLAAASFTMPADTIAGRRVVALGWTLIGMGTVGNVNVGISLTDGVTGPIAPGSWTSFGGFTAGKPTNPTATNAYAFSTWATELASAVPTGAHTLTLRAANIAAGTYTATASGLLVVLI
jgi:hypothetical protein